MKKRIKSLKFLKRVYRLWRQSKLHKGYRPSYRIVNIEKDNTGNYLVAIQVTGKNFIFKTTTEKLLKNDKLVNCFMPTDIRTLTYLGYLHTNSPKYEILAKQLSEKHDQFLFALRKKGDKKYNVVTATEISKNQDIIQELSQEEAHMVGLTTAYEQEKIELQLKQQALRKYEKVGNIKEDNSISA